MQTMNNRNRIVCDFVFGGYPTVLSILLVVLSLLWSSPLEAAKTVDAKIEKESAWTGEAVSLNITLYSPGPFSGTASFDLPELPQTVFIKTGNPVVGSESFDGESLFTQRHQITVYTQRSGEIVVPPIPVRFSGKKTFVGDPVLFEDATPELRFQSNRPPGSESLGVVIAATDFETSQVWIPNNPTTLQPGDVIQRTITRTASGTTAMMFQPASRSAPGSVRVYLTDPIVADETDRGQSTAKRIDTMKYQFERAGGL